MSRRSKGLNDALAWLVMAVLSTVLAACTGHGTVYHKYVQIDTDGWDTCSYAVFSFRLDSADSRRDLDMSIEMRVRPDYGFANLWLEISDNAAGQHDVTTDTLQLRTADGRGSRLGTFAAGLYSLSVPYRCLHVANDGEVEVRIRHLMDASPLIGINDVGIRLDRHGGE